MKYTFTLINNNQISYLLCHNDDYVLDVDQFFISLDIFNYILELFEIPEVKVMASMDIFSMDRNNPITDKKLIVYEVKKYSPIEFRYLASYFDTANFRLITGLNVIDKQQDYEKSVFLEVSSEVYQFLKEKTGEMSSGKIKLLNFPARLDNVDDIQSDFKELTSDDNFELNKISLIRKAYNELFQKINIQALFDFFNFAILNNELISDGIVITNKNRDDEYLKILNRVNSDDPEVAAEGEKTIEKLSNYLESMDNITKHVTWYNRFKVFEQNMADAETEEELNEAYNKYIDAFF